MIILRRTYDRIRLVAALLMLMIGLGVLAAVPAAAANSPFAAQDDNAEPTDIEQLPSSWNGEDRFTVLFMGMDRRPNARDTFRTRTDAMLLISIDPGSERIGILHIPRDLHFTPPGTDEFIRVNTLMIAGEDLQEGYGPYYAMDTLQYNLGIYIDRYIALDFEAFITLVDAVGGVEITTTYTINDPTYPDMNYGFDPFLLPAGTHMLDGRTALKFARTRHGDNDFLRGVRQMQLITALHKRIASEGMLPRLMRNAPALLDELERNVYTDLSLGDMVALGRYATRISSEEIYTGSINQEFNLVYSLPEGRNAYIPDRVKLPDLMVSVFGERYFE